MLAARAAAGFTPRLAHEGSEARSPIARGLEALRAALTFDSPGGGAYLGYVGRTRK